MEYVFSVFINDCNGLFIIMNNEMWAKIRRRIVHT